MQRFLFLTVLIALLGAPVSVKASSPPDFDAVWNYGDPAATEAAFREFEAKAADQSLEYRLQLQTQIARTHSLRAQFDEAHAVLDEVEKALTDATPVAQVRYLLERGRTHNSSGNTKDARAAFVHAWMRAQEIGEDFHAVDAAHMVAIADPSEAMQWNERGLELARASKDERARNWKGSLLNNVGWTHFERGDYDKALATFEEALAFRKEQGKAGPIKVARWTVARTWRAQGKLAEALSEQQALLKESGDKPDPYTWEEIAECLHALDRTDEARPWFAKAHEALSADPWMVANEAERLARLAQLAQPGGD
ncbi:MAG: tetratricopeptide repeat protein [Proteobacteria bacterium]|nr:tetratricopeptide repeat protein [Pseudomonadota bacterium]